MSDIKPDRFLRLPAVKEMTALGRTKIYKMVKAGTFPRQLKLGERTSVWSESSVRRWMNEQKEKADID